jgi:2-(1,2-epoxy-1,2-dihydrophenyl)acetyl-CoA isomerase
MTEVLADNRDGVLVLTFNRPDKYNAFDVSFIKAIRSTFERMGHGQDVDAVVLTGAGKAFCAGGDVAAMRAALADRPSHLFLELTEQLHPLILDIRKLAKPVVAALNGPVAGGGYGLALAADARIGCPRTSFTPAYSKLGIAPDGGLTAFLPRIVGHGVAQRIILRDETVRADDALRLGLVDEVVPEDQLVDRAVAVARKMGSYPMESFRYTKELINHTLGDFEVQLERERRRNAESAKGPWLAEGVTAFFEKREPVFRKRDKLLKDA